MNFITIFLNELCTDKYKNQNIYTMCSYSKRFYHYLYDYIQQ